MFAIVIGVHSVRDGEVDAFVVADVDRDGLLSFPEFREFVRQMARAGQPTARLIRNFAAYRIAFRRVDVNEDGFASPAELRSAALARLGLGIDQSASSRSSATASMPKRSRCSITSRRS